MRRDRLQMNDKPIDQWQRDAQRHVAALELALSKFKGDTGAIAYRIVALAFPSAMPHSKSLDYTLIDDKRFVMWAAERGWKVAPEEVPIANTKGTQSIVVFSK